MYKTNLSTFYNSLKNAFGSKNNFEQELICLASRNQNKGYLYFCLNNYLNFSIKTKKNDSDYPLLACNLDVCDIYNFIEDIDYFKLANAYDQALKLIKSQ